MLNRWLGIRTSCVWINKQLTCCATWWRLVVSRLGCLIGMLSSNHHGMVSLNRYYALVEATFLGSRHDRLANDTQILLRMDVVTTFWFYILKPPSAHGQNRVCNPFFHYVSFSYVDVYPNLKDQTYLTLVFTPFFILLQQTIQHFFCWELLAMLGIRVFFPHLYMWPSRIIVPQNFRWLHHLNCNRRILSQPNWGSHPSHSSQELLELDVAPFESRFRGNVDVGDGTVEVSWRS